MQELRHQKSIVQADYVQILQEEHMFQHELHVRTRRRYIYQASPIQEDKEGQSPGRYQVSTRT
jgi:hypothetical protein